MTWDSRTTNQKLEDEGLSKLTESDLLSIIEQVSGQTCESGIMSAVLVNTNLISSDVIFYGVVDGRKWIFCAQTNHYGEMFMVLYPYCKTTVYRYTEIAWSWLYKDGKRQRTYAYSDPIAPNGEPVNRFSWGMSWELYGKNKMETAKMYADFLGI